LVKAERFLGKIVACGLEGPGTAPATDFAIFAFSAFAFQGVIVPEGLKYF
jgi:hypothetical protein